MSGSKSPTSEQQHEIKLVGSRHRATARVPNFDELREAFADKDGAAQKAKLFELCALDFDQKLPNAARKSIGYQIQLLAGDDLEVEEISEHVLPDDAAEALERKRSGNPSKAFVALEVDEKTFVFFEPEGNDVDNAMAKKGKGAGIEVDLAFVEKHCFFGDLEELKRERPAAICGLFKKLMQMAGVTLEAVVKKA